jgi:hypothetical protein
VGDNHGPVTKSYATGNVSGQAAGGLVAVNYDNISQSYATGTVTGNTSPSWVGGLVGSNVGTIAQSYATGAVHGDTAGGLVGVNAVADLSGSITQSYATGTVSGGDPTKTGGSVGLNSLGGTVTSSYWDTQTTGISSGYGTNNGSFSAQGLTTSQFATASNFSGWSFGSVPGGSSCGDGACWVIVDTDGTLNNANDAAGATRAMLLSEWSKTITNPHQLQLMTLDPTAHYS